MGRDTLREDCDHDYQELADFNMEAETYVCSKCGDRYKLYYEDMK